MTVVTLSLAMVASSCGRNVDLQAISQLAENAETASNQFNEKIAGDIYDSCVRAAEYQPIDLLATPTESALVQRTQLLSDCEQSRSLETELRKTHGVLITYLTALGKLASDDAVNLDGIDAVQNAFTELPTPSLLSQQKEAGIGILNILGTIIRSFVEQSRLETLQRVIVDADPNVQTFVSGFRRITERGYIKFLENENVAIDNYYETYISGVLSERQEGDVSGLTTYLMSLQDQWRERRDSVDERIKLAQDYLRLIDSIASTHNDLKSKFAKGEVPDAQQVNQLINSYTAELKTLTRQIKALDK